jgi:hypothetical protein
MYWLVATNSTCIALLIQAQHVFKKHIHVKLVVTKNTCWVSNNKAIHVELVSTKYRNTFWVCSNKAMHVELVTTK